TFDPAESAGDGSSAAAAAELGDDVSVRMYQRVLHGYGINAETNIRIVRGSGNGELRDLWQWIRDAEIRRQDGTYFAAAHTDVSFAGVYDLLRLKDRQLAHLHAQSPVLAGRGRVEIRAKSRINAQRALALQYCGWGLDGALRDRHIRALEARGEWARAAATAFVYGDHPRCLRSLETSSLQDHKVLAFVFRSQLGESAQPASTQSPPADMYASPHLQLIFTYLFTHDWAAVLAAMPTLPLSDRLAVALRHLDDAALMRHVRDEYRRAVMDGAPDGLLVTGVGGHGLEVMRAYVDRTSDVQTAALVAIFDMEPRAAPAETAERWIYAYRHILNKWRLFSTRCLFDIAQANWRAAKGLPRASAVALELSMRPTDVRCTFCHQSMGYAVSRSPGARSTSADGPSRAAAVAAAAASTGGAGIGGLHGGNKNSGAPGLTASPADGRMLRPSSASSQPSPAARGSASAAAAVEPRRRV
ncbi:hypothetical protein FBU59_005543, partial [Linderina macrospora]